jgi:hypothetical protein
MSTQRRYPQEVRERAVRMLLDHRDEYPSQWGSDPLDRREVRHVGGDAPVLGPGSTSATPGSVPGSPLRSANG